MLPHPSKAHAGAGSRLQNLLEETARERRAAEAMQGRIQRERTMFGEGRHDWIVQRGIDKALACQDGLAHAPTKPSPLARARLVAILRAFAPRIPARQRSLSGAAASAAHPQETS